MSGRPALPNWVAQRDGQLEPFDGDQICRSVFAAGERVGQPDPFLARELTDGVLHFLASDGAADPLPSDNLAEMIVKVVRELGHPALALAYEQDRAAEARQHRLSAAARAQSPPADTTAALVAGRPSALTLRDRIAGEALGAYSRRDVYARDLVAAEQDGLLAFFDADTPLELTGSVVAFPPASRFIGPVWVETLAAARERVGQFVAIDGPEYALASPGAPGTPAWVRELRAGLRLTGLRAIINLNCSTPPAWAVSESAGPLFPPPTPEDGQRHRDLSDMLLEQILDICPEGVRVDWHLGEADFQPEARTRLSRLARRVIAGAPVTFVPDRAHRPVALAEGLDRRHPTVLTLVGISLARLVDLVPPTAEPAAVLGRLGSLVRLALSAGKARREFLRTQARAELKSGFEIERARLVVVPLGLSDAVRRVTGADLTADGLGLDFALQAMRSIQTALSDHPRSPPATLDGLPQWPSAGEGWDGELTAADGESPRQQIRMASALQAETGSGTARIALRQDRAPTPEEVAHWLWYAWRQTGVVRIQFVRESSAARQLSAGW